MRILAVDTTTPSGSVALLEDERLLGEIGIESAATHSARLLLSADLLLKSHGLTIGDVDGFAVSPGPGSFTGLRIGLSTVKAFAFATGKPVAAVSSLAALAWKHRGEKPGLFGPMLDAKKDEIYAALFEAGPGPLRTIVPEGAYAPEDFLGLIPRRRSIVFAGSGVPLCRRRLTVLLGDKARFSDRSAFIAAEIGRLGLDLLRAGRAVDAASLEPHYHRRSQAEEGR
ncbi:MAG: tRNA (adenosine(37)-N6)-threonylcarbamoyltransferase complex dimerization subunit type 1 TsaB [Candidatus Aminicenantes bacterium]|nr:tRNA (adenosine(37)-N6)-threonylcarbamoyltransferase complex dimerization subunit type 1 TsaB [Candidatus Aminicenantes bacterium]